MNDNKQDTSFLAKYGILEPAGHKNMIDVPCRILQSPNVFYNDKKPLSVNGGQWRMQNKRFVKTVELHKWAILWLTKNPSWSLEENQFVREKLLEGVKHSFVKNGIAIKKLPVVQVLLDQSVENIFELIDKNMKNPQLVMFVISEGDNVYGHIKSIADLKYGITTQCLNFDKLTAQMNMEVKLKDTPAVSTVKPVYIGPTLK